jgi:hypothetical protein
LRHRTADRRIAGAALPFGTAALAVFAVFTGNYQRELTFHPQKSSTRRSVAPEITAGFGLLARL